MNLVEEAKNIDHNYLYKQSDSYKLKRYSVLFNEIMPSNIRFKFAQFNLELMEKTDNDVGSCMYSFIFNNNKLYRQRVNNFWSVRDNIIVLDNNIFYGSFGTGFVKPELLLFKAIYLFYKTDYKKKDGLFYFYKLNNYVEFYLNTEIKKELFLFLNECESEVAKQILNINNFDNKVNNIILYRSTNEYR